jgi:hypothetical protein
MKRGKLNIIPELIKDRAGVAAIFKKSKSKVRSPKSETSNFQLPSSDSGTPSSNQTDTKN